MGFFHLHRSSSSSTRSVTSATSSTSIWSTPRTSTDSANDFMTATIKPHFVTPRAPILGLPFEILQHVASYLDDASAAKFSLSNRQICYAIGTQRLSNYISSSPSRFDARDRLENTIERALPGSWLCAWCDKFHPWSTDAGPASQTEALPGPCAEYNSYLTSTTGYTLRYHHLRLALAAHNFGPTHGIPLSAFTHTSNTTLDLFNTQIQTSTSHSARITSSSSSSSSRHHLLLHTSFSALLPTHIANNRHLIPTLFPLLPPILTSHRATPNGHSSLMAACDNVIRRGWEWQRDGTQHCRDCGSDWAVSRYALPSCVGVAGGFVRVCIQVWRDLGTGGGPFEGEWRAHAGFVRGLEGGCVREGKERGREGTREGGSVRKRFEDVGRERGGVLHVHADVYTDADANGDAGGDLYVGADADDDAYQWDALAYSWQLDKQRAELRDQEMEWRAIWKYIERRAGVEGAGG